MGFSQFKKMFKSSEDIQSALDKALALKEEGNKFVLEGDYASAAKKYVRVCSSCRQVLR